MILTVKLIQFKNLSKEAFTHIRDNIDTPHATPRKHLFISRSRDSDASSS